MAMNGGRYSLWLNPWLIVSVFLIFMAGALLGALVMRASSGLQANRRELYWQEGGKQISLARLTHKLDLSPEQQKQLETTLDDFVMYVQMLQAQMSEVRAHGKDRIMRVLNEGQKKKFEKLLGGLQARTSYAP